MVFKVSKLLIQSLITYVYFDSQYDSYNDSLILWLNDEARCCL